MANSVMSVSVNLMISNMDTLFEMYLTERKSDQFGLDVQQKVLFDFSEWLRSKIDQFNAPAIDSAGSN